MKSLTHDQIEHFIRYGFVHIPRAIDAAFCREQTALAWKRLGYEPDDPRTWAESKIHMPTMNSWPVREVAPNAWAAMVDLVGGEDRIANPATASWGDGFILNLSFGADKPWSPPSASHQGWHKDGDFFYHFLDSPEQGLLCAVYWSDIAHKGGGTYVIADSVPVVARFLNDNREGIHPNDPRWRDLPAQCSDFREITAETGDVFLLHPFMLHASSQNMLGVPRFMTNPCLKLSQPMQFDRDDAAGFSPIELAVLRGLGVERLDFTLEGERRENVPERVRRQREMLEQEKARLAGA
ncbi:MAG: hypothetical protein EA382_00275 [Spirochaetaceae bacterium]|nr:MAG: hypothetical protein EA382_00275 [Spirochaetaceae bacterium]